jgi:hypothetical protein
MLVAIADHVIVSVLLFVMLAITDCEELYHNLPPELVKWHRLEIFGRQCLAAGHAKLLRAILPEELGKPVER